AVASVSGGDRLLRGLVRGMRPGLRLRPLAVVTNARGLLPLVGRKGSARQRRPRGVRAVRPLRRLAPHGLRGGEPAQLRVLLRPGEVGPALRGPPLPPASRALQRRTRRGRAVLSPPRYRGRPLLLVRRSGRRPSPLAERHGARSEIRRG